MIASGVLAERADEVAEAFARHGLREAERRVQGEWAAVRAGARVIRLAVRVARADAEAVLAELLELAPGGLEERELDGGGVEYVIYGAPGELPALPDLRAAAGDALVDVVDVRGPGRLGGALEGVPPAGRRELALPPAARAAAVGGAAPRRRHRPRDRPRAGVRDRRAPHDAAVPRAAAASCEPARRARRLGLRQRRARDRRRAARLGAGAGLRLDAASVDATRANASVNGVPEIAVERVRPAPRRGAVGADRRRQPRAAAAARRRRRDDAAAASA